jgi:hypothetical protein
VRLRTKHWGRLRVNALIQLILNKYSNVNDRLVNQEWALQQLATAVVADKYPDNLQVQNSEGEINHHEFKIFSQNGEDGILLYIFSKIGTTHQNFVEIGAGDGQECNTANLSLNFGWHGLLVDANANNFAHATEFYRERLREHADYVILAHRMVTRENVNLLLREYGFSGIIDLLSIDIDGNDYWIWDAITSIAPRVVVIEYNAALGPEMSVAIKYAPEHDVASVPQGWLYYGASLMALVKLGVAKGYKLVGCDRRGVNAFFVNNDIADDLLHPLSPERAYFPHWWNLRRNIGPLSAETVAQLGFVTISADKFNEQRHAE